MSHQTGKTTRAMANPCVTHGGLGPNRRGERITEIHLQGWVEGLERKAESSGSKETQLPGSYLPGPAERQVWKARPNAAGSGRRPPVCSSPEKAPLPSAMAPSASKDPMPLDLGAGRACFPPAPSPTRATQEMQQSNVGLGKVLLEKKATSTSIWFPPLPLNTCCQPPSSLGCCESKCVCMNACGSGGGRASLFSVTGGILIQEA